MLFQKIPCPYNRLTMATKKKWTKFRHKAVFRLFHPIFSLYSRIHYGYTAKKFQMAKGQNYLILCNHSCGLDPFFVSLSFPGKPVYFVASDDLLRIRFASFWIKWAAAPIPKKKDIADYRFLPICQQIAKEGGNIGIFPEGNRTYSGHLGPLDQGIAKLAKSLGLPVLLYSISNGYGVDPRWGTKRRKGKMQGEVRCLLSGEEVASLSEQELLKIIENSITSPLKHDFLYKSKRRAEHLERVLYVCPKCKKMQTLSSKGNLLRCKCGLEATYEENMTFSSSDPSFPFHTVMDWYAFQKEFVSSLPLPDGPIFADEAVEVLFSRHDGPKKVIRKGTLTMGVNGFAHDNYLDEWKLPFASIYGVGITGKNKIVCYTRDGDSYTFRGKASFNAYKYAQMHAKIMMRLEESL